MLGVRVPAVAVSPLIPRGTVVSAPSPSQAPQATSWWDHTSVMATANRLLGVAGPPLTARAAWAAHFEGIFSLPAPRPDCPATLPPVAHALSQDARALEMATPLNDHHLDQLDLLCSLAGPLQPVCAGYEGGGRAAAVRGLPAGQWGYEQGRYPHLHTPTAQRLSQQHFGDISASLFGAYRLAQGVVAV